MKKVEKINVYCFDSLHNKTYTDECLSNKKALMYKLLDEKIEKLETRLAELKEAKEFLMTGKQIYLIKDNDSNYCYVDAKHNNTYEYRVINDKPVLIDADFNLFEIIEYVELDDIGQNKGNRNILESWIDKIVKVKKIGD